MFLTFLIGEEITVVPTKIDFARQTKNASAISWGGNSSVVKCPPPGWMFDPQPQWIGVSLLRQERLAVTRINKKSVSDRGKSENIVVYDVQCFRWLLKGSTFTVSHTRHIISLFKRWNYKRLQTRTARARKTNQARFSSTLACICW